MEQRRPSARLVPLLSRSRIAECLSHLEVVIADGFAGAHKARVRGCGRRLCLPSWTRANPGPCRSQGRRLDEWLLAGGRSLDVSGRGLDQGMSAVLCIIFERLRDVWCALLCCAAGLVGAVDSVAWS